MNGALIFLLFSGLPLFSVASQGFFPAVMFQNLTPYENTVYYGEQKIILIQMTYQFLKYFQEWYFPPGVGLQDNGGWCPSFTNGIINFPFIGECYFSLIISGYQLGQIISGDTMYRLYGEEPYAGSWSYLVSLPFAITVIPHPISLTSLPTLNATANIPFFADLRAYINYYAENIQAGAWLYMLVDPGEQDGLHYDPAHFAIVGTPTRTGVYLFKVGLMNLNSNVEPTDLPITVSANPNNKPTFKTNFVVASATPGKTYRFNLMELIEPKPNDLSNPISFRLAADETHSDWLSIGGIGNSYLTGAVPANDAGAGKELTLIASSNTGGDSEPLRILIPIATDPQRKATINRFLLKEIIDKEFAYDLGEYIVDPTNDPNLRLMIDQVDPLAPWLHVSGDHHTTLTGILPKETKAQTYQITMHMNTRIGGDSDALKFPLRIAIDPGRATHS